MQQEFIEWKKERKKVDLEMQKLKRHISFLERELYRYGKALDSSKQVNEDYRKLLSSMTWLGGSKG